jgi:hypothetical protein
MVEFNKINKLKDFWCFVMDCEGYWYKIPVNKKYQFERWVENVESMEIIYDDEDFTKYRCMHPVNYMFKDVTTLKENI